jgi:hypothetical protein
MRHMTAKWKKRLYRWASLTIAVVAFVELNNWIRGRSAACEGGMCKPPADYGLIINPFPDETAPEEIATNKPACVETEKMQGTQGTSP